MNEDQEPKTRRQRSRDLYRAGPLERWNGKFEADVRLRLRHLSADWDLDEAPIVNRAVDEYLTKHGYAAQRSGSVKDRRTS